MKKMYLPTSIIKLNDLEGLHQEGYQTEIDTKHKVIMFEQVN